MTDHLRLNLDLVHGLAIVNPHNTSHHLRKHDHGSEVSFHNFRFLHGSGSFLSSAEFLKEVHLLPLETSVKLPPHSAREHLCQLLIFHIEELVQVYTSVCVF